MKKKKKKKAYHERKEGREFISIFRINNRRLVAEDGAKLGERISLETNDSLEAKGTLGPRGPLVAQRWIPADQTPRDVASTNDSECPRKPTPYPPPGHRLIVPLYRPFFLA